MILGRRLKRPEPEVAEDAAGEWLDSQNIQQTEQEAMHVQPRAYADESHGDDLATVNERLDDLARRIKQLTRPGPEDYAPRRSRDEQDRLAEPIAPPVAPPMPPAIPSVQLPPSLGRALAEIATRQRALNGARAPARKPAAPAPAEASAPLPAPAPMSDPAPAPVPMQNLSGLEEQLRKITDQIDTLRRPDVGRAINALREELSEIGRTLNEALPRHALETIEKRIQDLTKRIAEGRQAGADTDALARIEGGLAEVRDALRGLTPAESLVGFTDAVAGLAHKIDLIVAQKDPETFAQLESTITTLRTMANHTASNETVSRLAAEVQALGEKIEQFANATAGGGTLNKLEHRIATLSDALAEHPQSSATLPSRLEPLLEQLLEKIQQIQDSRDTNNVALVNLEHRIATLFDALTERSQGHATVSPQLEALLEQLAEKVRQIQESRDNNNVAFGQLDDRIVNLMEKLDASDSRLGHLDAIERGLADLLVHVEDIRANHETMRADSMQGTYDLKHDLARTQDAIEGLHATLGLMVDRLATIENDKRGQAQPGFDSDLAALRHSIDRLTDRADADTAPEPMAGSRAPINPDLPADQPLEPGSGLPYRGQPTAQLDASPETLGGARPAAAGTPGSKSSFIAAARRAAQAAGQEAGTRTPRAQAAAAAQAGSSSLTAKIMKRFKSLFVAASVIAIVVGSVQIVGQMLDRGVPPIPNAKTASTADAKPETPLNLAAAQNEPDAAAPLAPAGVETAVTSLPDLNDAHEMPSLFSPPMLGPKNDVTGSISHSTAQTAPSTQPAKQGPSELPVAIGGVRLRSAAAAGDAAAAFEVGTRFADGKGVPVNLEEAAQWFERAAAKGLAPAQFRYASLLEKGRGVKKDIPHARRLYLAAAAKGNAKAMHNLAVLYAEGIDGKPDYANAAEWFRKAANAGVSDSQFNLGVLTARALGVEKDLVESYKWFALAAASGDRDAAKKRDAIAEDLDANALAAAKKAIATFVAKPEPEGASKVPAPSGGWDNASSAPPPKAKLQPTGPLSQGTFTAGKR